MGGVAADTAQGRRRDCVAIPTALIAMYGRRSAEQDVRAPRSLARGSVVVVVVTQQAITCCSTSPSTTWTSIRSASCRHLHRPKVLENGVRVAFGGQSAVLEQQAVVGL